MDEVLHEKGQNYLLIGTVILLVFLAVFFLLQTTLAESSSIESQSTELTQE